MKVYNEQNERLGDINEIILDKDGKAMGYVVGVGGFLGMGEHDIFVEPNKIKFVNEPVRTSSPPPQRTHRPIRMLRRPTPGLPATRPTPLHAIRRRFGIRTTAF